MSNVYHHTYVCVQIDLATNQCTAWQQSNIGSIDMMTASMIISFAFILNLIIFGLKNVKRAL